MKTSEKLISPILAEVLLKTNIANRKITQTHVDFLADQMRRGTYIEDTGESLKFSRTNKLLDGQHRLLAIIKSGKSYRFRIDEDLDDKIFNVIDTGRTRTTGDILSILKYKNAAMMTSMVRFILEYQNNRFGFSRSTKYPNDLIIKFIEENPHLEDIIKSADIFYRNFRMVSPSTLAGIYYILLDKGHSEQVINNFFEQYSTGLGLSSNSPVYCLRDKLIKNSYNKTKLKTSDKISLIISAWNSYIKGRTMNYLKIPEEFPKAI